MNFIEAVGDWKSNDEWRYADKEAAWKFFFAAGKESSQAVISAQCVKMSQYESIIFKLRQQLAISEAQNARLREALEQVVNGADECLDDDGWIAMVISMEAYHICDEALSAIKEIKEIRESK